MINKIIVIFRNPIPKADKLFNYTSWLPTVKEYRQSQYVNIGGQTIKNSENPMEFQRVNDLLDKYIEKGELLTVF